MGSVFTILWLVMFLSLSGQKAKGVCIILEIGFRLDLAKARSKLRYDEKTSVLQGLALPKTEMKNTKAPHPWNWLISICNIASDHNNHRV